MAAGREYRAGAASRGHAAGNDEFTSVLILFIHEVAVLEWLTFIATLETGAIH